MPQPKRGYALGSNPSHQRLMLRNLARSLFQHERFKTTEAKAKLLRPYAERLITKAKHGSIHDRRQVLSLIEDRDVVHKLFSDIGPRFSERNGGYTRVLKLGTRQGDGAEMALIELVDEGRRPAAAAATTDDATTRRRRLRRPSRRRGAVAEVTDEAGSEAVESDEELEDVDGGDDAGEAPEGEAPEVEASDGGTPEGGAAGEGDESSKS